MTTEERVAGALRTAAHNLEELAREVEVGQPADLEEQIENQRETIENLVQAIEDAQSRIDEQANQLYGFGGTAVEDVEREVENVKYELESIVSDLETAVQSHA